MPDAKLKVFVLWSPVLARDSKRAADQASAYLADPRVEHFWDLWSFGLNAYTRQLRYPAGETAWDIFVLYGKNVKWESSPPEPAVWLQNRDVPLGVKYSQPLLKRELEKLTGR